MAIALSPERAIQGRFGPYGGRYVPETLVAALDDLAALYDAARADPVFWGEFDRLLAEFVGRPSPLSEAPRLSAEVGAAVLLKREDLNHTGAHKINNTVGQALLALRMGKRRIIAETGAGQHGVATATVCARFGLECVVYMGAEDVAPAGAQRLPHAPARGDRGSGELGDADAEGCHQRGAARLGHQRATTHYIIGSVVGPDPYPTIVRDFQSMIGREAREQVQERDGRLPHTVSPAWAAGPMPSASSPRSWTTPGRAVRRGGGRGRESPAGSTARP